MLTDKLIFNTRPRSLYLYRDLVGETETSQNSEIKDKMDSSVYQGLGVYRSVYQGLGAYNKMDSSV